MEYAPVNVLSAFIISSNDDVVSVVVGGFPSKIAKVHIRTSASICQYLHWWPKNRHIVVYSVVSLVLVLLKITWWSKHFLQWTNCILQWAFLSKAFDFLYWYSLINQEYKHRAPHFIYLSCTYDVTYVGLVAGWLCVEIQIDTCKPRRLSTRVSVWSNHWFVCRSTFCLLCGQGLCISSSVHFHSRCCTRAKALVAWVLPCFL